MIELTMTQLRLARLASQRLTHECADDEATPMRVLADVCGVQAQDHGSALLGVSIRRPGLTAERIERARVEERTIATSWLMRGTLHMVSSEDLVWLVGLLGPVFVARHESRLRQLELSGPAVQHAVDAIADMLAARGPLTKAEIAEELVARRLLPDATGQRPVHLIAEAAMLGLVCLGPRRGAKQTYALIADWLGVMADAGPAGFDRGGAVAELARRYLEAFGPANAADFAYWSGLPVRDARAGFDAVRAELEEVCVQGESLWALPGSRALTCAPRAATGTAINLPSWDNYLMGYADRSFALGPGVSDEVGPNGGVLLRAVLEDGLVVGTWG